MNTHPHRRILGIVLLALLLIATACGASTVSESAADEASTGSDSSTSEEATSGQATPAPTPEEAIELKVEEGASPVEALLGIPIFDDDAMNQWFEELSIEAERVVAICMLSEGFEYSPTAISVTADGEDAADSDSLEYAETTGFGIVADFNEAEYDPNAEPTKNEQYLATLSEAERDAYFVALQGASEELDDGPFVEAGCRGQATDEVFSIVAVMEEIGPVFESYGELYFSDSRILATTSQWQMCMGEAGFTFADEDDMYDSIFRELDAILESPDVFDLSNFPEDESGEGSDFRPPLTAAGQARIDVLVEEEKNIAVANWTCREPIKDIELEVQREYENRFVAEVGPQVAALTAD